MKRSSFSGYSGLVFLVGLSAGVSGAVLNNPTILSAATAFSGEYSASNLFDGSASEYATAGAGAGSAFSTSNGTWVEMDFGSAVTMDRMIFVTRGNAADVVGTSRLILSDDSTFDGTDTIFTFNPTGSNGQGLIQSFSSTTARYARWEVTTSIGSFQNLGGMEMRFLNTTSGQETVGATPIGSATPFGSDFEVANATDGDAGRGVGTEYASQSLGTAMFVDFDFGSSVPISGFDWFDRLPSVDRTTAFDLLFSDDPTFASGVTTQSYTPGGTGWGYSEEFAPVTARYVRLDATASSQVNGNTGMQEIIFYTPVAIPETSVVGLGGLGL